jgi:hypothetical protein
MADETAPSATETAINAVGADAPGTAAPAPAPSQDAPAAKEPASAPELHQDGEPRHSKEFKALIDTMSAPDPNAKAVQDDGPADGPADKPEVPEDGEEGATEEKPEAKSEGKPDEPKPAPTEEEALLEGVRSERGKARIREMFAQKKALETDISEFRELVTGTGMSPEQFAQTLEFGRLVNTGEEKNIRVALEMIEAQRKNLYARLGKEAPGVDLLDDQSDLKSAVENMEITRDRAVELAALRRQQAQQVQRQQAAQQAAQSQQAYAQTVQQAASTMDAYLNSRAGEADHATRLKALTTHFSKQENMQAFVTRYSPDQWLDTVKLLYDNVAVPQRVPTPAASQPIHGRSAVLGMATVAGETAIERMERRMDSLGL